MTIVRWVLCAGSLPRKIQQASLLTGMCFQSRSEAGSWRCRLRVSQKMSCTRSLLSVMTVSSQGLQTQCLQRLQSSWLLSTFNCRTSVPCERSSSGYVGITCSVALHQLLRPHGLLLVCHCLPHATSQGQTSQPDWHQSFSKWKNGLYQLHMVTSPSPSPRRQQEYNSLKDHCQSLCLALSWSIVACFSKGVVRRHPFSRALSSWLLLLATENQFCLLDHPATRRC